MGQPVSRLPQSVVWNTAWTEVWTTRTEICTSNATDAWTIPTCSSTRTRTLWTPSSGTLWPSTSPGTLWTSTSSGSSIWTTSTTVPPARAVPSTIPSLSSTTAGTLSTGTSLSTPTYPGGEKVVEIY